MFKFQKKEIIEFPNSVFKKPKVSISVITYQHENYIVKCLEGILMQETTFPFEILLGEDCSNDNTRKICLAYAKKYPSKIRLFLHNSENKIKINGRISGRFNVIFNYNMARGLYIALCEGDDYWTDPLKLQKQIDFLENHPECSFCFHKSQLRNEDIGRMMKVFPENLNKQILSIQDYLKLPTTATSSIMFRNKSINVVQELLHSHGDFLLYCELLERGQAGFIDETMSVYRKHEGGISYNYASPAYLLNRIQELKKEKFYFSNKTIKCEISRILKEHIMRFIALNYSELSWKIKSSLFIELLKNPFFYKDLIYKLNKNLMLTFIKKST